MEFFCEDTQAECACDRIWKGEIKRVQCRGSTIEMDVSGKGSAMHVIIGEYVCGRYLCIPDWGVSSPLAGMDDSFWNREQLERRIGRADAVTVSEAVRTLSKYMEDVG